LTAKLAALRPHLNERQWRLLLAAEARSLGRSGISGVALAAGVSRTTIHQALKELDAAPLETTRARRPGGGRTRLRVRASRTQKEESCRRNLQLRCCARDGSWPSGAGLRGQASNHPELRWLKTVVVSVREKAWLDRARWGPGRRSRAPNEATAWLGVAVEASK